MTHSPRSPSEVPYTSLELAAPLLFLFFLGASPNFAFTGCLTAELNSGPVYEKHAMSAPASWPHIPALKHLACCTLSQELVLNQCSPCQSSPPTPTQQHKSLSCSTAQPSPDS